MAVPSSFLQRFPLCPIESNGNENFKVIQNPGFLHPQNWITGSLCHSRHTLKISEKSVHNFLSYLAHTHTHTHTHTHRQTDTKQSLAKTNLLGGGNKKHVMSVTPVLARPILSSCVCFNLTAWLRDCQCNFYCIVGVTSNVPLAWMKFETTTFSDLECNIIRKLLISLLVHMTSKIIMTAAYFYVKYLVICEFNASLP